jgi:outer membrane protein assembly factor BamB
LPCLSVVVFCLATSSLTRSVSASVVRNNERTCSTSLKPTLFADTESGSLFALDPTGGQLRWRAQLPQPVDEPDSLAVPTCGTEGYAVVGGGYRKSAELVPFTMVSGHLGRPVDVGLPGQVALSPDGRMAYVANSGDLEGLEAPGGNTITPVDLVTGRVLRPIRLPGQPGGLVLIDHGATLLVSLMDNGAVATVSTATRRVERVIAFPRTGLQQFDVGGPIVVDPTYHIALVGNRGQDLVVPSPIINVLDLKTMTPESPIDLHMTDGAVSDLAVSADGKWAFAAGLFGVLPVDVADRTVTSALPNTNVPVSLVVSPTSRTLYLGQGTSNNPLVAFPFAGSPMTSLHEFGSPPLAIAVAR